MIFDLLGWLIRAVGILVLAGWLIFGMVAFLDWIEDRAAYRQRACPLCGHRHGPAHKRAHDQWERLP